MVKGLVAPILRFLGLGQFDLARMFHGSNSEAPSYIASEIITSNKNVDKEETSATSPLLAIAGLFEKYPELIHNQRINSLIEREDNASIWEIIETGFKEGIIPPEDFSSFKNRYESLSAGERKLQV